MKTKSVFFIFLRYFVLILLGLNSLFLIYSLVTPLTVQTSFNLIKDFYSDAVLLGDNVIFFKGYYAYLVPACIAGAAYYLLLILNLSTPMTTKQRVYSLLFTLMGFFILNIIRIVSFAILFEQGYQYFDLTHQLTWYFGSTLFIVILWFTNIYLFKIQDYPGYTDMKNLLQWRKELENDK